MALLAALSAQVEQAATHTYNISPSIDTVRRDVTGDGLMRWSLAFNDKRVAVMRERSL